MVPPEPRARKTGARGRELRRNMRPGAYKTAERGGALGGKEPPRSFGYCRACTSKMLTGSDENTVSFGILLAGQPVGRSMMTRFTFSSP